MNDKDQAAIDHVASVSKHPHAALIVKWLITGWGVKRKGAETVLECPYWMPEVEYRLVEPKPAKPAYRVYLDKDGIPFVARRSADGNTHQTYESAEWVSEWIEYDPPKKWPTPLVERIATIDIKAAEWIVDHWDELLEDRYNNNGKYFREHKDLIFMFDWSESEQGLHYWNHIDNKLRDQAS